MADFNLLDKLEAIAKNCKSIIKIGSENKTVNNILNITLNVSNPSDLDKGRLAELESTIRQAINSGDGFSFINEKTNEPRQLIEEYSKSDEKEESREFIAENIPPSDQSIWYTALILKSEFEKGNTANVARIKDQMIMSRGDRGRNIANLCSSGYLESLIIPLKNTVGDDTKIFNDIYETIVEQVPFAIFVASNMGEVEIKEELLIKIKQAKNYGWNKVTIHGIGEDNVKTIQKLMYKIQYQNEYPEIQGIDVDSHGSSGKIISVAINII